MNVHKKHTLLFNVIKDVDKNPLEIPLQEFDDHWWPLISNVWVLTGGLQPYTKDGVFGCYSVYVCHLAKTKESSAWKEGMPIDKRRKTAVHIPFECEASIKITCIISTSTICIEWYKDTPDHTHSIEDNDRIKCPGIIKDMIKKEASKPYHPPAIVSTIKELTSKDGLGGLTSHMDHKEVANVQRKSQISQQTHLISASNLGEDIEDAIQFLQLKEYYCESFSALRMPSKSQESPDNNTRMEGLFFAHPWQLQKLEQHGWLVLIDSTHNTNKHGWKLFTLYVHDSYSSWDVGAHFFVSNEDIAGVTVGLKTVW